ncbi:acetyltransferase [Rhizobium etli]|uniref:acetyltransferase n=1 Tax=Rhizobium etli TaxID=29449 RepID=UPI001FCBCA5F|nr:acetyltransferase [Rhizobium etli]
MADDEQGAEMQRLAPESALKTGRYDVFAKKDIPASIEPGYRGRHKNPGGGHPRKSTGTIAETRKGTKTNRAGPGKGNAFPRAEPRSPP